MHLKLKIRFPSQCIAKIVPTATLGLFLLRSSGGGRNAKKMGQEDPGNNKNVVVGSAKVSIPPSLRISNGIALVTVSTSFSKLKADRLRPRNYPHTLKSDHRQKNPWTGNDYPYSEFEGNCHLLPSANRAPNIDHYAPEI